MGTRSLTVFKDEQENEIVVMYRQFDGYPGGHGGELADFLKGKKIVNGIPCGADDSKMFNGMGCLAAAVVAHFKNGVGGFYLHSAGTRDCWEDYTYYISGNVGKEPKLMIFAHDKEVFSGYASEFDIWLESWQEDD